MIEALEAWREGRFSLRQCSRAGQICDRLRRSSVPEDTEIILMSPAAAESFLRRRSGSLRGNPDRADYGRLGGKAARPADASYGIPAA